MKGPAEGISRSSVRRSRGSQGHVETCVWLQPGLVLANLL